MSWTSYLIIGVGTTFLSVFSLSLKNNITV